MTRGGEGLGMTREREGLGTTPVIHHSIRVSVRVMKNAKELTQEVTRIRQRTKELSGFWISELAAALYAIEWAAGKRERPPSADIGSAAGDHGKIADRLLHAVTAAPVKKPRGSSGPSPRPSPRRGEVEEKAQKKPAPASKASRKAK